MKASGQSTGDKDFEKEVYDALCLAGMVIPSSEREVDLSPEYADEERLPLHLQPKGTEEKDLVTERLFSFSVGSESSEVSYEMARAARNMKNITEEVEESMRHDRESAKSKNKKP